MMLKSGNNEDNDEARRLLDEPDSNIESVDITIPVAVTFLCWSCIALVGLYFLLKAGEHFVVMTLIVFFCIGRLLLLFCAFY